MEFIKIVLFSTVAAMAYGILHDQVTAHLCVEYFTIAHPPIFPTQSPFLLVIGWGILATWWVGLPLGIALAIAARIGSEPKMTLLEIRPSIFQLLAVMALCAFAGGMSAWILFTRGDVAIPSRWTMVIGAENHAAFLAAAWAHLASYASGILGGLLLVGYVAWTRIKRSINQTASLS